MEGWMFNDLLEEMEEALTVSFRHSMSSTNGNVPIDPHAIMTCGIHFLTGDTITSLVESYCVPIPSARRMINIVLDALDFNDNFEPLQIKLTNPATAGFLLHCTGAKIHCSGPRCPILIPRPVSESS